MRKLLVSFWVVLLSVWLAACAGNKLAELPPESSIKVTPEYQIGVGDSLQVNVWRNQELSLSVPVRPDGKISMPLIGDILAAGLTPEELSGNITKGLSTYVRNPQVTVIVTNPSSSDFQRRVRITGAVNAPQSIAYRDGMTVLDLVLLAGGTNQYASPNSTKLYRKIDGVVKVYPIYLDDLMSKGEVASNYTLQPSDIVSVPERSF